MCLKYLFKKLLFCFFECALSNEIEYLNCVIIYKIKHQQIILYILPDKLETELQLHDTNIIPLVILEIHIPINTIKYDWPVKSVSGKVI